MKRIILVIAIVLVAGVAIYGFSGSSEEQQAAPQAVAVPVLTIGQGQ